MKKKTPETIISNIDNMAKIIEDSTKDIKNARKKVREDYPDMFENKKGMQLVTAFKKIFMRLREHPIDAITRINKNKCHAKRERRAKKRRK